MLLIQLILLLLSVSSSFAAVLPKRYTNDTSNEDPSLQTQSMDDLLQNAFLLSSFNANFAAMAYCPTNDRLNSDGELLDQICDTKFCRDSHDIEVLELYEGDISYLILQDHARKNIILSFKGTSSPKEWTMDTNYRLKSYHSWAMGTDLAKRDFDCHRCKAHRGFLSGYKIFYEQSFKHLHDVVMDNPDHKFYITGHSLGGALAQIAGVESYLCNMDPIIVNYGSPKVFNHRLADWLTRKLSPQASIKALAKGEIAPNSYFRVTNSKDIVPMLPPYSQGFSHSGYQLDIEAVEMPVHTYDLRLEGCFDNMTEFKKWKARLKLLVKNYKKYLKDPLSGYSDFVQLYHHRYYYQRMGCGYASVESDNNPQLSAS